MEKNLVDRMIQFSGLVLKISKKISDDFEGQHLRKQLVRSNTSASLNYAEAIGGESRKDFIHKMNIALKELRETYMNMKIIKISSLTKDIEELESAIDECNQLISIFVSSVNTAKRNERIDKR
jgi:four helix bundle protein